MTELLSAAALLLGIYLAASLNFALLLARGRLIPDLREQGSGNPGVSNVYRICGPAWAAIILALDITRAVGAALASLRWLPPGLAPWGALALVTGNIFPAFHRLRGGKGVANLLGFVAGLDPLWAPAAALLWPISFAAVRATHLSSFVMLLALIYVAARRFAFHPASLAAMGASFILIVWAHRQNLRLWSQHP